MAHVAEVFLGTFCNRSGLPDCPGARHRLEERIIRPAMNRHEHLLMVGVIAKQ